VLEPVVTRFSSRLVLTLVDISEYFSFSAVVTTKYFLVEKEGIEPSS
jgi:hypothetical protein